MFNPWVRKISWSKKWQPTPVFLPGESQGRAAWWAAIYGVAQSWTRLKRLSSSSSSSSSSSKLPEFTQTHVHRVSDAIQPSHPLSSLSPPAPNPSQHQGLSN